MFLPAVFLAGGLLAHMLPTPIAIPRHSTRPSSRLIILTLMLCPFLCGSARGQSLSAPDTRPSGQENAGRLKAEQVVENLVRMNLQRAQALQAYESTRIYRLEYKGFPGGRTAEMVVNMKYQAPGSKVFEIVSSSGSKMLIDRVFKKLMEGEKDAFEGENQKRIAMNQENYEFALAAYEPGPRSGTYVLSVKPRTKNKYLFQGKIWVDEAQFAIVRMEGEPAKNPSFWIKGTQIETLYINVSDFWLPAHNHSVTSVRLGGHADFSIEYTDYRITGASPLRKVSTAAESAR
ncbi:MAG: LolA family protein [Candidatus Angelobacter sp.]